MAASAFDRKRLLATNVRRLIALAAIIAALVHYRPLGKSGLWVALAVGGSAALIVRFAKRKDLQPMRKAPVRSGIAAFVGIMSTGGIRPPYEAGDEYKNAIIWVVLVNFVRFLLDLHSDNGKPPSPDHSASAQARTPPSSSTST